MPSQWALQRTADEAPGRASSSITAGISKAFRLQGVCQEPPAFQAKWILTFFLPGSVERRQSRYSGLRKIFCPRILISKKILQYPSSLMNILGNDSRKIIFKTQNIQKYYNLTEWTAVKNTCYKNILIYGHYFL